MRVGTIVSLKNSFGGINNQAIWDTVAKYSLDGLAIPLNEAKMSDVDYLAAKGKTPILWADPHNWWNLDGAAAGDELDKRYTAIGFSGANAAKFCPLLIDYELHSITGFSELFQRWRWHRYKRETFWTMEPLQGGWVGDPQIVSVVNNDINLTLVPQTYRSQMQPVAQDACFNDLAARGFKSGRIKTFYGCFWRDSNGNDHFIPPGERMDGFIWTLEKLYGLG